MRRELVFTLLTALLACSGGYLLYEKNDKKKIEVIVDPYKQDKEDIKNVIETAYFNFSSGAYFTSNGVVPEDFPFYNVDLLKLATVGGFLQITRTLAFMSGKNGDLVFEFKPINIKINSCDGQTAETSYDVNINVYGEKSFKHFDSDAKKVGGKWKINGQPLEENSKQTKPKKH